MRITLCQLNPVMGDIAGNTAKLRDTLSQVSADKPDLVVFPELFLQGYPPRDLLEHRWFVEKGLGALEEVCNLSKQYPSTGILAGFALRNNIPRGKGLSNSAVLVSNGEILFHQNKSLLPTYDVFDERRYFDPARKIIPYRFKGQVLGISVCEDAWNDPAMWARQLYDEDPVAELAGQETTLFVNISGSPFHAGKERARFELIRRHAQRHGVPFVFVNQVGGNDELIFDGNSMVFDAEGRLCGRIAGFTEGILTVDTDALVPCREFNEQGETAGIHDALVLGVRDYVHKCGFSRALVGLSGGIDSAVTVAIAVEALGSENVTGVTMPSKYSSPGSIDDSRSLAENLGIEFREIPIQPMFDSFLKTMESAFAGKQPDITEENMQARIRGNILMALSNKFNSLLLSTGNKSELAVGYCTLYGDMNGGLGVISDLPKTTVYEVARHINRKREIIPRNTLTKAPSAELRPDQKDQDTLPPYDVLDGILALLIEKGWSRKEIVREGYDEKTVDWVIRAVRTSEYKRRQAAPGLRVTPKAFGSGRRFPIAARYDWS